MTAWCALVAPAGAYAGGVALPVRGVKALSMGGAFVAGAEGTNAIWFNPANLDGRRVDVEVGATLLRSTFVADGGLGSAANEATPLPNPTLGVAWTFLDRVTVGLGAFAPYSPQSKYAEDGPQRYSLTANDHTTQLFVEAAVAVRFGSFRVGAGIQNLFSTIRQRTTLSGYPGLFGDPRDPALDVANELELVDNFTLSANFGASWDAGPVTVGLAVQLPYTVGGDAKFRVRLGESAFFDPIEVEGDTVKFEVPFPWIVRSGVLWRITERASAELAVTYEGWSRQERLVLDPAGRIVLHDVPGIGDYEMRPIVIDRRLRDTIAVHLGGRWRILDDLELRGGTFVEPSAFPDETYTVAQPDGTKIALLAGASYTAGDFTFDLAFGHVFQTTRRIATSEARQINPTNPDDAVVVGNGTYESGIWVGGLGVSWSFR